jgi:hypothetical protein
LVKLDFDGDINTSGEVELLEFVHGASRGIYDIKDAFVGAEFELIDTLFVNVWGTIDAEFLNAGGQRDRSCNFGTGALGGIHDFTHGFIQGAIVISTETDADALILRRHIKNEFFRFERLIGD